MHIDIPDPEMPGILKALKLEAVKAVAKAHGAVKAYTHALRNHWRRQLINKCGYAYSGSTARLHDSDGWQDIQIIEITVNEYDCLARLKVKTKLKSGKWSKGSSFYDAAFAIKNLIPNTPDSDKQ